MTAKQAPRKSRRSAHRIIMETLGNEWCGTPGPPRDNRKIYVHDHGVYRVFATSNDGFEVGIGYPNQWQVFMRWEAAKMLAWWVFKVWVTDWFGLRNYLWYRALFRSVNKQGRWEKPRKHPRAVWRTTYDAWWEAEGRREAEYRRAHNDHPADADQGSQFDSNADVTGRPACDNEGDD